MTMMMMMANLVSCWLGSTSHIECIKLQLPFKPPAQAQIHSCLQARNNRNMWAASCNTFLYRNPFNSQNPPFSAKKKNILNFISWIAEVVENIYLASGFFEIPYSQKYAQRFIYMLSIKEKKEIEADWKRCLSYYLMLFHSIVIISSIVQRNRHWFCNQYVTWRLLLI